MLDYKYGKLETATGRKFISVMINLANMKLDEDFAKVLDLSNYNEKSGNENTRLPAFRRVLSSSKMIANSESVNLIEILPGEFQINYIHPCDDIDSMKRMLRKLEIALTPIEKIIDEM